LSSMSDEHLCSIAGCDNDANLRCSRCKRSWYCSVVCQKRDWKFHKDNVCIKKEATPTTTTKTETKSETATDTTNNTDNSSSSTDNTTASTPSN
jgi:hypothetical protein